MSRERVWFTGDGFVKRKTLRLRRRVASRLWVGFREARNVYFLHHARVIRTTNEYR